MNSQSVNRFVNQSYRTGRSRIQNTFFNQELNSWSSQYAEVISVLDGGITKDKYGVDQLVVIVRVIERVGQPMRLVAKDSLAHMLLNIVNSKTAFAFTGNVAGRYTPYLFATAITEPKR